MSQQDNFLKQKMTNGKFFSLLSITLVATILIFSLLCYLYVCSLDKNVLRAEPYLEKISYSDPLLRDLAIRYTAQCSVGDKDCIVNSIYRNVVEGNKYLSDPNETELIRSPENTLLNGGGDCEDLAILASSLLNTLNVSNYLVLTSNHAYALACGVNATKIRDDGQASLKEIYANKIENETNLEVYIKDGQIFVSSGNEEKILTLDSGEYVMLSKGKKEGLMNLNYSVSSRGEPLKFYVVLSQNEIEKFFKEKTFEYLPDCSLESGFCEGIPSSSIVFIYNPNSYKIKVDLSINFIYPYDSSRLFVNNTLSFYEIKNETCVVLETTAGEYGFVGLASEDLVGEKLAFDSRTKEYFKLS